MSKTAHFNERKCPFTRVKFVKRTRVFCKTHVCSYGISHFGVPTFLFWKKLYNILCVSGMHFLPAFCQEIFP